MLKHQRKVIVIVIAVNAKLRMEVALEDSVSFDFKFMVDLLTEVVVSQTRQIYGLRLMKYLKMNFNVTEDEKEQTMMKL